MSPATVLPYSPTTLCEVLASSSGNPLEAIRAKAHAVYFEEYFAKLGARTIVLEPNYVDHDFLEDFAAYYVRCFRQYSRTCVRVHFFREAFDTDTFAQMFTGNGEVRRLLQSSYLGFIVVRPLPQRIIGRTCLATYPSEDGRVFPAARSYEANLFGLALQITTIAFQEQDRAVAACATSALWSVFHGTGLRFQHSIPSPAEITRRATATNPLDGRAFPAGDGLMFVQMADAVRSCDLEPLWITNTDPHLLRASIHAYLGARVPLLLNGEIVDPTAPDDHGRPELVGVHAVVIVGYHFGEGGRAPGDEGFRLCSSRIDKLYCHDDGVGPFARMEFVQTLDTGESMLSTSQARTNDTIGKWGFVPDAVLVPLYHKIRVPFLRIYQEVRAFDDYLRALANEASLGAGDEVELAADLCACEWDIRLTTVNDYKIECMETSDIEDPQRILEASLPRFVWLARAVQENSRSFDLLFDATGLELSNLCLCVVRRGSAIPTFFAELNAAGAKLEYPGCEGIIDTLRNS